MRRTESLCVLRAAAADVDSEAIVQEWFDHLLVVLDQCRSLPAPAQTSGLDDDEAHELWYIMVRKDCAMLARRSPQILRDGKCATVCLGRISSHSRKGPGRN